MLQQSIYGWLLLSTHVNGGDQVVVVVFDLLFQCLMLRTGCQIVDDVHNLYLLLSLLWAGHRSGDDNWHHRMFDIQPVDKTEHQLQLEVVLGLHEEARVVDIHVYFDAILGSNVLAEDDPYSDSMVDDADCQDVVLMTKHRVGYKNDRIDSAQEQNMVTCGDLEDKLNWVVPICTVLDPGVYNFGSNEMLGHLQWHMEDCHYNLHQHIYLSLSVSYLLQADEQHHLTACRKWLLEGYSFYFPRASFQNLHATEQALVLDPQLRRSF